MIRPILALAFVVAALAGCGSAPDNVAMPPADQREKEAKTVIPPLDSGGK